MSGMDEGPSVMIRLPGYGDHLAATSDPEIRQRQFGAPDGFADVVGALARIDDGHDDWHVSFSVADRDVAADRVVELGGRLLGTWEGHWTRAAELVDPQGATFRVTQFAPDAA
ncbi:MULTISPECIES: VOC family protein [unclassified Curtobacterium]|uniref:VOC family protein n=1 Tax=unclassified Curtobacterium TaxID=257496 RepID=UPI003823861E